MSYRTLSGPGFRTTGLAFGAVITFIFSLFSIPSAVLADADVRGDPPPSQQPSGSNASFDHRLPPVIPGETLHGPGGDMAVWSTSGNLGGGTPPRVNGAPNPPLPKTVEGAESGWSGQGGELPEHLGVIVDQRKDKGGGSGRGGARRGADAQIPGTSDR